MLETASFTGSGKLSFRARVAGAVVFVLLLIMAHSTLPVNSAFASAVPDSTQIITVSVPSATATSGTLTAWQKTDGKWTKVIGPVAANVGAAGVGRASEGSSKTPEGVWPLTESFGRLINPGTKLSYFKTDVQDWWDSNPSSPTYNTHVRQAASPGGLSENLYRTGNVYNYAVVMGYNRAGTPGAGSAFFLHISDGSSTAGCVSTDRNTLVSILQWLDPAQSPTINIGLNLGAPADDAPQLPGRDNPEGAFAAKVSADGRIDVDGWAFDGSNLLAGIEVVLRTNGDTSLNVIAREPRTELASYGIPGNHGFTGTFPAASTGTNQICMYLRNVGVGSDQLAQCIDLIFPEDPIRDDPRGAFNGVVASDGSIKLDGWAFDPNAPYRAINVMFSVNGEFATILAAQGPRPELAQFGVPGNHGFVGDLKSFGEGNQRVCMYASNLMYGKARWVQCVDLPAPPAYNPRGAFHVLRATDGVHVDGWAFDQSDFSKAVTVMITVNGQVSSFAAAQNARPDLAAFGVPGNHGFAMHIPGGPGPSEVCLFAFNIGAGSNQLVGCELV